MNSVSSRTTVRVGPTGAVLLLVVLGVVARPPQGDPQLAAIVWCTVLGLLVVGALWPLASLAGLRLDVHAPRDLVVGDVAPVRISLYGHASRLEVRVLDPPSAWHRSRAPGGGDVPHLAHRRGEFPLVRVEVRATRPLGVLTVTRHLAVELDRPVTVAPRPSPVHWAAQAKGNLANEVGAGGAAARAGDVVRSVRPYVTGDAAHLVHWPSSARAGALVVRELEPPVRLGAAIAVDLRTPADRPDLVEAAASRAAGLVRAVLGMGGQVLLVTNEADGPVVGRAMTPFDAGRRLARAVAGVPPPVPTGWPVELVTAVGPVATEGAASAEPIAHATADVLPPVVPGG